MPPAPPTVQVPPPPSRGPQRAARGGLCLSGPFGCSNRPLSATHPLPSRAAGPDTDSEEGRPSRDPSRSESHGPSRRCAGQRRQSSPAPHAPCTQHARAAGPSQAPAAPSGGRPRPHRVDPPRRVERFMISESFFRVVSAADCPAPAPPRSRRAAGGRTRVRAPSADSAAQVQGSTRPIPPDPPPVAHALWGPSACAAPRLLAPLRRAAALSACAADLPALRAAAAASRAI